MAAKGWFTIGEERFEIDGHGLRDKSWGPRHWQAINWYRWCPMNFGPDFAMMISLVATEQNQVRQGGMVLKDGVYDMINEPRWTPTGTSTATRPRCARRSRPESGAEYSVDGRVMSLIPLRNRRKTPDGTELTTRITEGMTEYRCNGQIGYGLSEYLDQIVDGLPTGTDFRAPAAAQ